jgi:hypothetical protein
LLSAGCASAPTDPSSAAAPAREPPALAALPSPALDRGSATGQEGTAVAPDLVVDVEELKPNPNAGLICRTLLRPNSNVLQNHCMTPAEWKIFEREEARQAEELVRRIQDGRF